MGSDVIVAHDWLLAKLEAKDSLQYGSGSEAEFEAVLKTAGLPTETLEILISHFARGERISSIAKRTEQPRYLVERHIRAAVDTLRNSKFTLSALQDSVKRTNDALANLEEMLPK